MFKYCKVCGREFDAEHGGLEFCSDECRRLNVNKAHREAYHRRRKPPQPTRCVVCGREFQPTTRRNWICSDECKQKRRRNHNTAFYQRKLAGLTQKRAPFDKPYWDYLAHLEKAYGYADDGTIRAAIDSWFEGRK